MPRNTIDTDQIRDGGVFRVDLSDEVRFRAEGIQYPIDELITVVNEARLFRAECLIIKPTGKVTIQSGGRIVIKR